MGRIDELIEAVADEIAADTTVLLDDTICRRQLAIDRLVDLATALSSRNLVDLDRRTLIDTTSGQNAAGWIALNERIAPGLAHRRVRTARRLADRLAETDTAWTTGLINTEHVRVINDAAANLRIGDRICALQGELIRLAGELTFSHWRQMVIYLVRELDQDGAFDPDAELERNHATLTDTIDGNCVLNAHFDRVRYHRIKHHIDTKTQELFRHYAQRSKNANGELPIPSTACLRALAIYELIEAGAAADGNVAGTHATVVLTPTQLPHGHDLHQCPPDCATADPAADAATTPTTSTGDADPDVVPPDHDRDGPDGDPCEHDDDPDPARRHGAGIIAGWRAWTIDGAHLPACSPDLMALLCDANLELLAAGADARPLALGRTQRLFLPPQRRAIAIRDGGCVFPGCPRPASACRLHHIRFWHRDRGPTNTTNGAMLCGRDHGIPHRDGWDMFLSIDEWAWFRTPTGHTFWGQRHGHQRTGPTPDHPDYIEPAPPATRTAQRTAQTPARTKRSATAPPPPTTAPRSTRPTEGRAPPGPGDAPPTPSPPVDEPTAPTSRPNADLIPPDRRRSPDDVERGLAALTELRMRLRREHEAELAG